MKTVKKVLDFMIENVSRQIFYINFKAYFMACLKATQKLKQDLQYYAKNSKLKFCSPAGDYHVRCPLVHARNFPKN